MGSVYATGDRPVLVDVGNDSIVVSSPLRQMWKVSGKLSGPVTDYVLMSPADTETCLRIADLWMSVSATSDVTLYFGDGSGAYDTFLTLRLAAGIPFVLPSPENLRPGGGPGDELRVTTTAGDLYINLTGVEDICTDVDDPYV